MRIIIIFSTPFSIPQFVSLSVFFTIIEQLLYSLTPLFLQSYKNNLLP